MSAQADYKPVEVVFDGESYTVPPALEWDVEVLEQLEAGALVGVVRLLIGDDGWARFKAKRRTVADLRDLMAAIEAGVGSPS